MDFKHKICVITGGSSGIGYSLAEALAKCQARLILLARDGSSLEAAADALRQQGAAEVACVSADVARSETPAILQKAISQHGAAADLVINSAGVVSAGHLDEVPLDEWRRQLDVNVLGTVNTLNATLPAMRTQRSGHIVNMASAAGLAAFPGMSAYCASKAAVIAMSDALRAEVARLDIGVTTVCPGFVQTPIAEKIELFGRMNNPRTRKKVEAWFKRNNLAPETVARATMRGIRKRQALVVVGRDARYGYWTQRMAPGILRAFTAKAAGRTPRPATKS